MKNSEELFKELTALNVNSYTESKNGLTYLSWAKAWQVFKEHAPDADYKIITFGEGENACPYMGNGKMGYMVMTNVTACGKTYEMWLPVMDNANKTMKDDTYNYTVRGVEKTVEAISMFDVNKALMRCLAKNLSMFGLGLYIYAGEDLPFTIEEPCTKEQIDKMKALGVNMGAVKQRFKKDKLEDLTFIEASFVISAKENSKAE